MRLGQTVSYDKKEKILRLKTDFIQVSFKTIFDKTLAVFSLVDPPVRYSRRMLHTKEIFTACPQKKMRKIQYCPTEAPAQNKRYDGSGYWSRAR